MEPWPEKIAREDYDFRSWESDPDIPAVEVIAGCMYEYARESYKLRCLIRMMHRQRRRENARKPEEGVWLGKLTPHVAEEALGAWLCFLAELARELAANRSFEWVRREAPQRLKAALASVMWTPAKKVKTRQFVRHFDPIGGVDWGFAWRADGATCVETFATKRRSRAITRRGEETVLLRIRWKDVKDAELGKAMEQFARSHRPRRFKERATSDGPEAGRGWTGRVWDLCSMRLLAALPREKAEIEFGNLGFSSGNMGREKGAAMAFLRPFERSPQHANTWLTAQREGRKSMSRTPK